MDNGFSRREVQPQIRKKVDSYSVRRERKRVRDGENKIYPVTTYPVVFGTASPSRRPRNFLLPQLATCSHCLPLLFLLPYNFTRARAKSTPIGEQLNTLLNTLRNKYLKEKFSNLMDTHTHIHARTHANPINCQRIICRIRFSRRQE